jgi:hypothetical protein
MFDLDPLEIEFACPSCGFYNNARLKQVRLNDVLICRGCKGNLQLVDQMGQMDKARRQTRRAVGELEEALSRLGHITLKF